MVSVIGAGMWRATATRRRGRMTSQRRRSGAGDGAVRRSPAFALIDQNGKPVTLETLARQAVGRRFIFTHCAGPVPDDDGEDGEAAEGACRTGREARLVQRRPGARHAGGAEGVRGELRGGRVALALPDRREPTRCTRPSPRACCSPPCPATDETSRSSTATKFLLVDADGDDPRRLQQQRRRGAWSSSRRDAGEAGVGQSQRRSRDADDRWTPPTFRSPPCAR